MSFHWCDNLHTAVFSPRDYQVELVASAFERNTIICLGHKSSKEFIALKLLQEICRETRSQKSKICVYLSMSNKSSIYNMLQQLTDLRVYQETSAQDIDLLDDYHVYVLQPKQFLQCLVEEKIRMKNIRLLIIENCHHNEIQCDIKAIFKDFYILGEINNMPKILGLAGPLHNAKCALAELSAMLNTLEKTVQCKTETASDIVTVLRYCSKPFEYIVQCAPYKQSELCLLLQDILLTRKTFLTNHRYDPFEIYSSDEFAEELEDIPDPKKEPLEFLDIMLQVLLEMGPWCADRVAFNVYQRIEKQKIKTPHERHYILLCLVNTALLEVHSICEQNFRKSKNNHKECIENFSSPKVLKLLEVLRLFKPDDNKSKNDAMNRISCELDTMDFQKLSRILEAKCHSVEQAVEKQQLESRSIVENLDSVVKPEFHMKIKKESLNSEKYVGKKTANHNIKTTDGATNFQTPTTVRRTPNGHNNNGSKRRPFRRYRDQYDSADALCSIIFCNSNYTARVLFELLAEMSRHDPSLKFIKCQYTTDRVADPITEPKEAESEHRRQEEVLKRFRMRDCNILIGTSILEEGIDVPKCNLVIRWDPPTTYRSYVQCKGKARAVPAYHILLVAPNWKEITNPTASKEQLNDKSHNIICSLGKTEDNYVTDSDNSDSDEGESKQINGVSMKQKFVYGSSKGTIKILNPDVITNKYPSKVTATSSELILKEINDEAVHLHHTENHIKTNDFKNNHNRCNKSVMEEDNALNNSINLYENTNCSKSVKEKYEIHKMIDKSDNVSNKNIVEPHSEKLYLEELIEKKQSSKNENYAVLDLDEIINGVEKKKKVDELNSPQSKKVQKRFVCLIRDNDEVDSENSDGVVEIKQFENMNNTTTTIVEQMAEYREIEKILLQKCANVEPHEKEHREADMFNNCINPYKPLTGFLTAASVDLSNSIALVNKYCAKLPSDTFTKLTPLWRCAQTMRNNITMYQYTIRLPINSPLKYDIVGLPMPTHVLARRMVALQACIALHKSGELDDNLQPIGKEAFRPIESDWENFDLEEEDEKIVMENSEPRPGTTKRRQYYYKRIASEFCDCRPVAGKLCYLYLLDLTLQCPIPEEQNTRGRKIYPPENAMQGFGILTLKKIPKVSSFPIFTRSGEVKVSLVLHPERVVLNEQQISCINEFINYTFSKVLRLKKFLMLFDPESTENCVFIVPTIKAMNGDKSIDWKFLDLIQQNANMMPTAVPEEERHAREFSAEKFNDAVVMPWYRNQDQPHYFYVAEICHQLSPLSTFPSKKYHTFMHYYYLKYGLKIHPKQPLLDVDHTSARLNFLTPRYVNRKGVALPTSSEATKRAKRENLELKQILVPELCTVHPFPASLWRTAVCLPCILYRINGLLLADDIRKKVVRDIGLGQIELSNDQNWPMLDFGWSLSDVLKKTKANKSKNEEERTDNSIHKNKTKNESVHSVENLEEILKSDKHSSDTECNIHEMSSGLVEIGTWFNEMADNLNDQPSDLDTDEEDFEVLKDLMVVNYKINDNAARATSPTFIDIQLDEKDDKSQYQIPKSKKDEPLFVYYDSDTSYSDSSFCSDVVVVNDTESSDEDDIVITSKNEAETLATQQDMEKLNKQLSIIQATKANDRDYHETKNLQVGYNFNETKHEISESLELSIQQFEESIKHLINDIRNSGMLVQYDCKMKLPTKTKEINKTIDKFKNCIETYKRLIPYASDNDFFKLLSAEEIISQALNIDVLHALNLNWLNNHPEELYMISGCGDLFDNFNDSENLTLTASGQKQIRIDFESQGREYAFEKQSKDLANPYSMNLEHFPLENFSFDYQPDLSMHPGPSPSIILQALTMSNANDGINLERLETIGDSFLKYAITTYLYITYENVHEGKLSHLRSKQVANLNLYRLGRRKKLGEYMIATKFEPSDNWLPPCYYVPKELEKALIEAKIPPHYWSLVDLVNIKKLTNEEICELVRRKADEWGCNFSEQYDFVDGNNGDSNTLHDWDDPNHVPVEFSCFIPYNLVSQHSIPDKSVADCVEALIGAYLIECGLRGALLFMAWLGIRVIPYERVQYDSEKVRKAGTTLPDKDGMVTVYGSWSAPQSPLLRYTPNAPKVLDAMLVGYDEFEKKLGYKFRDRSYLLQAMTHASYTPNRLTDCYQRLEFLGDAVLDYLITRHLYEDPRQHSPGALTDLRSALVNNTIFASLAVRHGFHKYFRHLSPGLNDVIDRFVRIQTENGHSISEEYYLLSEEECDDAEDVEVPKALGDVFESVAGAIFLDSNMSLDAVWLVYYNMMRPEIEQFSNSVPKSPIRELLELEPETAKFGKPEKLADGRRVRVTVEVFCKGIYRGIGRNYRIAKCTAAKCALRHLKKMGLIEKRA